MVAIINSRISGCSPRKTRSSSRCGISSRAGVPRFKVKTLESTSSRIFEEYHRQNHSHLPAALIEGVATAVKAVLYTAVLVSAGIAFWSWSPLRFQAEMGYQLLIILTMSMLGGLLLLPALIAILKPQFVVGESR